MFSFDYLIPTVSKLERNANKISNYFYTKNLQTFPLENQLRITWQQLTNQNSYFGESTNSIVFPALYQTARKRELRHDDCCITLTMKMFLLRKYG